MIKNDPNSSFSNTKNVFIITLFKKKKIPQKHIILKASYVEVNFNTNGLNKIMSKLHELSLG